MEQLSIFEEEIYHSPMCKLMLIPKSLLSPLEMKGNIKSERFRRNQLKYSRMVRGIQEYHNCSFFHARELFFHHRDNGKPIRLSIYF